MNIREKHYQRGNGHFHTCVGGIHFKLGLQIELYSRIAVESLVCMASSVLIIDLHPRSERHLEAYIELLQN